MLVCPLMLEAHSFLDSESQKSWISSDARMHALVVVTHLMLSSQMKDLEQRNPTRQPGMFHDRHSWS